MSQPSIPDITPTITVTREDAMNLLLCSMAMENMALSHILNAEGERMQHALGTLEGIPPSQATIDDILAVSRSIHDTMRSVLANQINRSSEINRILNYR